jgi:uncharacterized membrane protein YfcA
MAAVLVALLVFAAVFVQTLSGFGFALIVMPIITLLLGLGRAAPLVALLGLTVYSINLIRYRQAVNLKELIRLGVACALGVPIGIWALIHVDESIIKPAMGLVLILYAAYTLLGPEATRLASPRWVYPAGFAAGCLGGAYNTPGPPVIVYGSLRQWPKDEFRAVLQALFFVNGLLVVASHALARHMTADVLTFYLYSLPALLLGVLAGSWFDLRLNRERFRLLVTVLILILGLSLMLSLGR